MIAGENENRWRGLAGRCNDESFTAFAGFGAGDYGGYVDCPVQRFERLVPGMFVAPPVAKGGPAFGDALRIADGHWSGLAATGTIVQFERELGAAASWEASTAMQSARSGPDRCS